MSTWSLLGPTWRVWVPAVVISAAVQAALVAPTVTPGVSWAFIALTLVSLATAVATVAVIGGRMRAATDAAISPWPGWGGVLGILLLLLAITASAVIAPWLVIPAATVGLIMVPAILGVTGRSAWGFAIFRHAPLRAILLTVLSALLVTLTWLGALLLGLFVTGWVGAGLTWLLYAVVGSVLIAAWMAAPRRDRP